MAIDRERALTIQRTALADWIRVMAQASAGARSLERDGVVASAVPACPDRSVPNSVTYADTGALFEHHPDLGRFYAASGVEAWTVWVPEFDRQAITGLERAGHRFDGKPMAMVLELDGWEQPELGDLAWDAEGDIAVAGEVNDRAYGYEPESGYARAMRKTVEGYRLYQAWVDGTVACVAGAIEHPGGDLGIYFVATLPEYRGRGLTTRLMGAALTDARDRGLATSSLQASAMGEPVYAALGYERCFRLHLYERRGT